VKSALLVIAVLIAYPVLGQEVKRTTTTDLCREDEALWESKLNQPSKSWSSVANDVDSKTLVLTATEMNDCLRVDKGRSEQYLAIVHWLFAILFNRESDFLIRHHLLDQFYQEDEAGAR
jgi:hypothetical protein